MENPGIAGFWLSPQQKQVWTRQQEGRAYQSACLVIIEGALPVEILGHSLNQLVARHEILRTVYRRQPGMMFPFQVILENADPYLEIVDLSNLAPSQQKEQLDDLFREEQVYSVAPERGPVLAAKLATLAPNRCALFLSLPALAADRRSLQVLVRELGQLVTDTATEGGEEPLRYVQFAQWQNDLAGGNDESSREGQEFWKNIGDAPTALALPHELKVERNFHSAIMVIFSGCGDVVQCRIACCHVTRFQWRDPAGRLAIVIVAAQRAIHVQSRHSFRWTGIRRAAGHSGRDREDDTH